MKRTFILIGLVFLTACSMVQPPPPTDTPLPPPTDTPLPPPPTDTPVPPPPTDTPLPPTPAPTDTLAPTETLIPTDTPVPVPTEPPTPDPHEGQGDLLFEDHFDKGVNWGLGDFENWSLIVDGGVLTMTLKTNTVFALAPTGNVISKNRTIADFYAQVTVTPHVCRQYSEYGLAFRGTGTQAEVFDQFYVFVVRCNATWALYRYIQGDFVVIAGDVNPSPAINKGPNASNQLGLRVAGDEFRLYANGIYLTTDGDEKIPGEGRFALYGASFDADEAVYVFDDFSVWRVTP